MREREKWEKSWSKLTILFRTCNERIQGVINYINSKIFINYSNILAYIKYETK